MQYIHHRLLNIFKCIIKQNVYIAYVGYKFLCLKYKFLNIIYIYIKNLIKFINKTMRILKSHPFLKLFNAYLIDHSQPSNINYL